MRKFFKEFKEFISRGNIVDLSVAVIIGGAFSAIVTALTNKVLMPLINLLLSGGGGLESAYTMLKKVYTDGELDLNKSIYIDWGAFITAIINFILIALIIFILLKVINSSRRRLEAIRNAALKATNKELRAERREIKEQAKKENKKFKEVWAEHQAKKLAEAEEKAKIEAEEKAKAEELEKLNNPSEQELLRQIRDLLAKK